MTLPGRVTRPGPAPSAGEGWRGDHARWRLSGKAKLRLDGQATSAYDSREPTGSAAGFEPETMSPLTQALALTAGFETARTPAAIGGALRDALKPFGCGGLFAGAFPSSQAAPQSSVVAARTLYAQFSPPGWLEAYARLGLDRGNPVIFGTQRRASAFRWSDPGFDDLKGWRGLAVARECGIGDGIVVPCHEPFGRVGVISIGFERIDLAPQELTAIALAARMAHDRMTALAGKPFVLPALTPRERDCLCYVAEGLSDGQIAAKLAISVATAHAHVENAKRKLGARTRAQAVARLCSMPIG